MKRLVIILGMHRSGTSLTARMCERMGAYLGEADELNGPALGNPDGHFENIEIVRINNNILRFCNREWYSLEALDPDYNSPQIIKAMEEIKSCIRKLLEKSEKAAIKDPRISVMLPLWDKVLKELKVEVDYIWVFRNPLEVMESLRKRNGYSSKHSLLLWVHYNLSILKFLKEKEYLLINYRDILEHAQVLEEVGRLFGCKLDDDLKRGLNHIIKHEYCHSDYSYQDVQNMQNELVSDLYGSLLKNGKTEINVPEWERRYKMSITKADDKFMDYEILEDIRCLKGKEIIIYGAGNYGKQAAEMLQELGISEFDFCDKDICKQGKSIMGGKVFEITDIEEKKNILLIIAIADEEIKKEVEQTLVNIKGAYFLSFFALKMIWKRSMNDNPYF